MDTIQEKYSKNKAFRLAKQDLYGDCAKCRKEFAQGEMAYKDVMTGKASHVTCRAKGK